MPANPINFSEHPVSVTDIQDHRGFRLTTTAAQETPTSDVTWGTALTYADVSAIDLEDQSATFTVPATQRIPFNEIQRRMDTGLTLREAIADALQPFLDAVVDHLIPVAAVPATP